MSTFWRSASRSTTGNFTLLERSRFSADRKSTRLNSSHLPYTPLFRSESLKKRRVGEPVNEHVLALGFAQHHGKLHLAGTVALLGDHQQNASPVALAFGQYGERLHDGLQRHGARALHVQGAQAGGERVAVGGEVAQRAHFVGERDQRGFAAISRQQVGEEDAARAQLVQDGGGVGGGLHGHHQRDGVERFVHLHGLAHTVVVENQVGGFERVDVMALGIGDGGGRNHQDGV